MLVPGGDCRRDGEIAAGAFADGGDPGGIAAPALDVLRRRSLCLALSDGPTSDAQAFAPSNGPVFTALYPARDETIRSTGYSNAYCARSRLARSGSACPAIRVLKYSLARWASRAAASTKTS